MLAKPASVVIPLQMLFAVAALALLALWPPRTGAMMLVPIGGGGIGAVARVALAGGAVLIGMGPFPGSLVVRGDRARIARGTTAGAIVILAAPPAGCRASGGGGVSA
jgi:hypothetical protein